MAKPSQTDIEQMIQYARPTNRDLARRDINQAINSSASSLMLKVAPYRYSNGSSRDLLCLYGTVACQYKGNRYNIPVDIWLQQDHPIVPPLVYVRPTPNMYVSPSSNDVQPDGTVVIPYLKHWRHPNSDLMTLINAMSGAFSQSPPVYAGAQAPSRPISNPTPPPIQDPSPYPTLNQPSYPTPNQPSYPTPNPTPYPAPNQILYPARNTTPYPAPNQISYPTRNTTPYQTPNHISYPARNTTPYPTPYSTPYPTNTSSMPMPVGTGMGGGPNTAYSYPHANQQTQIHQDVYRNSIQTAVLDKVRYQFDETMQIGNAEINSLKKTEQDLMSGEIKIQLLISDVQQQQVQAQSHVTDIRAKTDEMIETAQKMSVSASEKENSIKDDALIIPAPVYKQLLQAFAEEHAIQDLLYHLADGLRRESIGLDTYLKRVRELSQKQFMLRATMHKCRQVANLPIK